MFTDPNVVGQLFDIANRVDKGQATANDVEWLKALAITLRDNAPDVISFQPYEDALAK